MDMYIQYNMVYVNDDVTFQLFHSNCLTDIVCNENVFYYIVKNCKCLDCAFWMLDPTVYTVPSKSIGTVSPIPLFLL